MATFPTGILIAPEELRLVSLRARKGIYQVAAAGTHELSAEERPEPGAALKAALKRARLAPDSAWLCIPKEQATLQPATLPTRDTAELAEMARFEAERHIPFNAERHGVGFHVLREAPDGGTQVLLAAADAPAIERAVKCAFDAGVRALGLNVSSVCLMNAFLHSYGEIAAEHTVVVAGLGLGTLDLVFASEGRIVFSRSVPLGLRGLVQDWQNAVSGASVAADTARIALAARAIDMLDMDGANDPEGYGPQAGRATRAWSARLMQEIRRSYDFARREMNCPPIEGLILAGEGAILKNLDGFLRNALNVEALILNPLGAIEWRCDTPLPFAGHELTVPFGAAIQGDLASAYRIDLTPKAYYARIERSRNVRRAAVTGAIFAFTGALAFASYRDFTTKRARLADEYNAKTVEIRKEVKELKEKETQIDVLERHFEDPTSALAVLGHISQYPEAPERIALTSIAYSQGDNTVIEGHAQQVPDINRFVEYLKSPPPAAAEGEEPKPLFAKVEVIGQDVYNALSNRPPVYRFRLQCELMSYKVEKTRPKVTEEDVRAFLESPPEPEVETQFVPANRPSPASGAPGPRSGPVGAAPIGPAGAAPIGPAGAETNL